MSALPGQTTTRGRGPLWMLAADDVVTVHAGTDPVTVGGTVLAPGTSGRFVYDVNAPGHYVPVKESE